MDKEYVSRQVDSWIHEDDLASNPTLKVVRKYDLYSDMDEDEYEAYRDFMYWYLTKDHTVLMSLPASESTFWAIELDEAGDNVSAFNTHDFEKLHPFNKYHYKLKKIYERVKDLAITHSCISDKEAKERRYEQFKELVRSEFRDRAVVTLDAWKKYPHLIKKEKAFERINELNGKIRKCKAIWREFAFWGTEGR